MAFGFREQSRLKFDSCRKSEFAISAIADNQTSKIINSMVRLSWRVNSYPPISISLFLRTWRITKSSHWTPPSGNSIKIQTSLSPAFYRRRVLNIMFTLMVFHVASIRRVQASLYYALCDVTLQHGLDYKKDIKLWSGQPEGKKPVRKHRLG